MNFFCYYSDEVEWWRDKCPPDKCPPGHESPRQVSPQTTVPLDTCPPRTPVPPGHLSPQTLVPPDNCPPRTLVPPWNLSPQSILSYPSWKMLGRTNVRGSTKRRTLWRLWWASSGKLSPGVDGPRFSFFLINLNMIILIANIFIFNIQI